MEIKLFENIANQEYFFFAKIFNASVRLSKDLHSPYDEIPYLQRKPRQIKLLFEELGSIILSADNKNKARGLISLLEQTYSNRLSSERREKYLTFFDFFCTKYFPPLAWEHTQCSCKLQMRKIIKDLSKGNIEIAISRCKHMFEAQTAAIEEEIYLETPILMPNDLYNLHCYISGLRLEIRSEFLVGLKMMKKLLISFKKEQTMNSEILDLYTALEDYKEQIRSDLYLTYLKESLNY